MNNPHGEWEIVLEQVVDTGAPTPTLALVCLEMLSYFGVTPAARKKGVVKNASLF